MKTISKLMLVTALAISSFSFANVSEFSKVKPLNISAEISQILNKQSIASTTETTFQVTFVVNKEKQIVIIDVDTDNPELKEFIKDKLNYKTLKSEAKCGLRYFLPVTLKVS